MDVLWGALDTNHDNNVSFNEFFRKLSRYGVKNRSKEEVIIYAIIEAAQRSNVKNLSKLFEMIDKKGRGFISREDFIDICLSLQLKVDKNDLQKFVDHFWKDKEAGIDYPGFLRLFSRYQMKLAQEENARSIKNRNVIVTDETVRMKKDIYSRIDNTMKRMGKTLTDLFAKVDKDGDRTVTATELYHMF